MFRTARPASTTRPLQPPAATCPECGAPVDGITAAEPGRHTFVGCGHAASTRSLRALSDA